MADRALTPDGSRDCLSFLPPTTSDLCAIKGGGTADTELTQFGCAVVICLPDSRFLQVKDAPEGQSNGIKELVLISKLDM